MLLFSLILMLLNPPAWLLAAVWGLLPTAVVATDEYRLPWNLNNPFVLVNLLGDRDRFDFADHLLSGMHTCETARWSARRGMLLDACLGPFSGVLEDPGLLEAAAALGRKHGKLLDVIGIDILRAAADRDNPIKYESMSQKSGWLNHPMRHPYFMLRYLVALDTVQREGGQPEDSWLDLHNLLPHRRSLMPQSRALGKELAFSIDRFRDGLLFDVAVDSGFAGRHAMLFFPDRADQLDQAESIDRITILSITLATHNDIDPDVTRRLGAWAVSNSSSKAGFALDVTGWWCSHGPTAYRPTDELADQLFTAAIRSLGDGSILYSHPNGDYRVRQAAQFAIIRLDKDGSRSVPFVRDWLVNDGDFPRHPGYGLPDSDPDLIAAWAEHLSDLAWSDDIEIRRWLARSLPLQTGTPSDARIDEVISRLLIDEDEDIRWDAEYAAELRQEQRAKQTP